MTQGKQRKPFTAEVLRMKQPAGGEVVSDSAAVPGDLAKARHEETMAALRALREEIETIRKAGAEIPEDHSRELQEATRLKEEIAGLRDAIIVTKREIAALRHPEADSDLLLEATDEMDAVVQATESATHVILESAEKIDELAGQAKQSSGKKHIAGIMDEICERAVKVFEACNFQDITGQRIAKVVATMKFIEERVNIMIEAWGIEAFEGIEVPEPHANEDTLLSGPQHEHEAISQDDIDKMFD